MTPAELHTAALAAIAERRAETERLRELAERATPGPWHSIGQYLAYEAGTCTCYGGSLPEGHEGGCGLEQIGILADAKFVAAFDPPTVLALLDAFDRDTDALESVLERHRPDEHEPDRYCADNCDGLLSGGWPCPDAAAALRALEVLP